MMKYVNEGADKLKEHFIKEIEKLNLDENAKKYVDIFLVKGYYRDSSFLDGLDKETRVKFNELQYLHSEVDYMYKQTKRAVRLSLALQIIKDEGNEILEHEHNE